MPSKSNLWAIVAMALAVVCIFVAMKLADYAGGLELVKAWTKDLGVLGMVLFALLSGISVVFFSRLHPHDGERRGVRASGCHYALGSLLGLIPATLVFVYMGSLGVEAATGATSSLELGLRVLGFVATVVVSIYIARISTRALEQAGL